MKPKFEHDEVVFRGRIIEVHKVRMRVRGGRLVDRDFVRHPGAAVVLPVLDDGSIVLIRNYRFAVGKTLYEAPAGTLEPGEGPLSCARRELAEETGYTAATFRKIGTIVPIPGTSDEVHHIYLARGLRRGRQRLEPGEEISVRIVSDAAAERMVARGEIIDAKTIAALAIYWARTRREV